ncbi:MAG: hypothetical protein VXZ39_03465 [Planctomycetota bacterium]|nr:hypothetical protein [Planctomycetota bacterium]
MAPTRRTASLALALTVAALSAACAGGHVRADLPAGPRFSAARLGELRGAMTCDGDWLGGSSSNGGLAADLDLASRWGVEVVIDMRSGRARASAPLAQPAAAAGLEVVEIDPLEGSGTLAGSESTAVQITDLAVDRIRTALGATDRPRALLLDDDGRLAAAVYAVHLVADGGVDAATALRAASSTGFTDSCEAFVTEQVARIREGR